MHGYDIIYAHRLLNDMIAVHAGRVLLDVVNLDVVHLDVQVSGFAV